MKPFRLQEVSLNETCSESRAVQYLSNIYPSKYCLKQEDVSALFSFNCALVHAIGEVPANEKNLKLNETLEILSCADDDNLLGENKHTFYERNEREALLVPSNEDIPVENEEVR